MCSSATISGCVPTCNATRHGFELLATIDGTDTKLTCNVAHGLYSWVGAASEGGYLGADASAFLSAILSGAAGYYALSLAADAGNNTELTIQPGQNVHIIGDPNGRLWGGGFRVIGQLTLANVRLAAALSVTSGGSLALSGCELVASVSRR